MNEDSLRRDLEHVVGTAGLVGPNDVAPYESGFRYGRGKARCVVRPATLEQLQDVVRLCAHRGARILAQGANTGLTGASTPDDSGEQIVVSLGRLRTHCDIRPVDGVVEVDAGMTLSELNQRLEPAGYRFPIELGADPQIGGMVATNTGGSRLVRYGDVRQNLVGIEAVLYEPPGDRMRFGRGLRKDNTGFDLKQAFVGTSGAAGIVTRATLRIHPLPRQTATALVAPISDGAVPELLSRLETQLGDFLSVFEGMSAEALSAAIHHVPGARQPFDEMPEFTLLIELESALSAARMGCNLQSLLDDFLAYQYGTLVKDALSGRGEEFWRLRHAIGEAVRTMGHPIAFDISVPRSQVMAFRKEAAALVRSQWPSLRIVDFGHVADGGLHFNLVWPRTATIPFDPAIATAIREVMYKLVVEGFGGTFSAEHGIGPHNLAYYKRYTPERLQEIAGRIQRAFDPRRISAGVEFDLRAHA